MLLRLALGTRVVRTTPEKTPCRDPIFPDQFTFTVRADSDRRNGETKMKVVSRWLLRTGAVSVRLHYRTRTTESSTLESFFFLLPPFSPTDSPLPSPFPPPATPRLQIDDKLAGTCLDIAIVESQLLGAPKVLGTTSIDLSTFTRHHGKTEADWPIHMKGKAVNVHVRAYFSPLQSTGPSAVA